MSAPLEFAARLLARRGALVERDHAGIEAILPPAVAAELGLAEHAVLGDAEAPGVRHAGYGSPLLERMVTAATRSAAFAAARADVPPPRLPQARAAAEAFAFRNGIFTVAEAAPAVGHRLIVHAAFTLHGDERREGLCTGAASVPDATIVPGFAEAAPPTLAEGGFARAPPEGLVASARAALAACAAEATRLAQPFREGTERRLGRDRDRIESYFADLLAELGRRATRSRASPADLGAKREALAKERAAKLEELSTRYASRLEVKAIALVLLESPVCRVRLELRRRKARRELELEFDGVTRALVPPACAACGSPAPRPAACDDAVHLLCEACAPRAEGRIACAACKSGPRSSERPAARAG